MKMCSTWSQRFSGDPVLKEFWKWSIGFFRIIQFAMFIVLGRIKQEAHYYDTNNGPIEENVFKEQDCLIKYKSLLNRKGSINSHNEIPKVHSVLWNKMFFVQA